MVGLWISSLIMCVTMWPNNKTFALNKGKGHLFAYDTFSFPITNEQANDCEMQYHGQINSMASFIQSNLICITPFIQVKAFFKLLYKGLTSKQEADKQVNKLKRR